MLQESPTLWIRLSESERTWPKSPSPSPLTSDPARRSDVVEITDALDPILRERADVAEITESLTASSNGRHRCK